METWDKAAEPKGYVKKSKETEPKGYDPEAKAQAPPWLRQFRRA